MSKERRRGNLGQHNRPGFLWPGATCSLFGSVLFCLLAFVGLWLLWGPSPFFIYRRSQFIFTVLQGGIERCGTLVSHRFLCACGGRLWARHRTGALHFFVPMDLTLPFYCLLSFSHPSISRLLNGLMGLQGKLPFYSYILFSHSGSFILERDAYWISIGGQKLSILCVI